MMKNKGKRLVVLLIAACMILSMFSGMTVSAATDAEIYATTNTIKKVDGKYYYVNASGKMDKKTGGKSTFTITDLLVPFTFTELRTKDY